MNRGSERDIPSKGSFTLEYEYITALELAKFILSTCPEEAILFPDRWKFLVYVTFEKERIETGIAGIDTSVVICAPSACTWAEKTE